LVVSFNAFRPEAALSATFAAALVGVTVSASPSTEVFPVPPAPVVVVVVAAALAAGAELLEATAAADPPPPSADNNPAIRLANGLVFVALTLVVTLAVETDWLAATFEDAAAGTGSSATAGAIDTVAVRLLVVAAGAGGTC
jgi:hypothetical protein